MIDITWILALIIVVTYAKFSLAVYCVEMSCVTFLRTLSLLWMVPGWRVWVAHKRRKPEMGETWEPEPGLSYRTSRTLILAEQRLSWLPPPWLEERPWELGLLVNTLTSLTALYNLNFPDALHDKKLHIWSRAGKVEVAEHCVAKDYESLAVKCNTTLYFHGLGKMYHQWFVCEPVRD